MAQGDFTKEEAAEVRISFDEIIETLTKRQKLQMVGNMNDVYLFLSAAEKAAPFEKDTQANG